MTPRDFQAKIILSAIARGAHAIGDIARNSYGVYPLELLDILKELTQAGEVDYVDDGYYLVKPAGQGSGLVGGGASQRLLLPEPHPLDYDWRFDRATTKTLVDLVMTECYSQGSVLLIGAPSVFIELSRRKNAPYTTLIDGSSELIDYLNRLGLPKSLKAIACDLMSDSLWEPDRQINIVVCDPPWYTEYYAVFLAQASYATSIGAIIAVSLLPINTRPRAIQDRWEIIEIAHKLGLHIQHIESAKVRYQTPGFEAASLYSAGINTNGDWRQGDLVIFRKTDNPTQKTVLDILASARSYTGEDREWAEILLGTYKVKLRGPFDDYDSQPAVISIEKEDTLPTVSRRYAGRKAVDIWFWDNRVFGLKGKASFWAALHTIAGRPIPASLAAIVDQHYDLALKLLKENMSFPSDIPSQSYVPQVSTLETLKSELDVDKILSIEDLKEMCRRFSIVGHLAILTKSYLDKIISRQKTIESRFSKVRIPPFQMIKNGDVLFLKETSGPILAVALVADVQFFGSMEPNDATLIMQQYSAGLALEEPFKQAKQKSKYATLVHISEVLPVNPISVVKSDRRPWIVLNYEARNNLF